MSSPRFIPMPLSATVRVRADLSGIRMTEKLASPSANSGSVSAAYRSRSQASEAFEISSRRKISFSLYSECATIASRRLTSAWKALVSWVMVCRRGLAGTRRGYVTEALRVQDACRSVPAPSPSCRPFARVCAETGTAFAAALRRTNYPEACRMPRRQRSTVRSICVPSLPVDHALVNDDAKRHTILAALFGNAKQRLFGRLKSPFCVARGVAVRFFANYRNRDRCLTPQGEIESKPTKDRDHDIQAVRRIAPQQCPARPVRPQPQQCLELSRSQLLRPQRRRGQSAGAASDGEAGGTGRRCDPRLHRARRDRARRLSRQRHDDDRRRAHRPALLRAGARPGLCRHRNSPLAGADQREGPSRRKQPPQ